MQEIRGLCAFGIEVAHPTLPRPNRAANIEAHFAYGFLSSLIRAKRMAPRLCYTIWFSQRTGSTLLTTALEATGVAGKPHEWFYAWLDGQHVMDPAELQMHIWENGSTPNG